MHAHFYVSVRKKEDRSVIVFSAFHMILAIWMLHNCRFESWSIALATLSTHVGLLVAGPTQSVMHNERSRVESWCKPGWLSGASFPDVDRE